MKVINLKEKYSLFSDKWSPRIIAECNDQLVKIAKVEGEFVWHHHEEEDELFYVVKGKLYIDLKDDTLELNEGEMTVIPKGVEHRPHCEEETWIMLFEPKSTLHTGNTESEITNNEQENI